MTPTDDRDPVDARRSANVRDRSDGRDTPIRRGRAGGGSGEADGGAGEVATLAGGCFWCTEAVFERLRGVRDVVSGYAGGHVENPSYREVCSGTTGHAEAVQVSFDPDVISYEELLEVFFATHDPTTPNQQGPDVGPQYRSAIFYGSPQQKEAAERVIARLDDEGVFDAPIVTEVEPLDRFYRAEDEHQDFYREHPNQPYCQVMINPKVAKLRERFRDRVAD